MVELIFRVNWRVRLELAVDPVRDETLKL